MHLAIEGGNKSSRLGVDFASIITGSLDMRFLKINVSLDRHRKATEYWEIAV